MRRARRWVGAALLLALVSGCGGGSPVPSPGDIAHPGGDATLVRMQHVGGFAPVEYIFASFPTFTLFGDGRVVVEGPQVEIYPAPALPPVLVRTLTESGVQAVLREVVASEQFSASAQWLGAQRFVADASTTVFDLRTSDLGATIGVYALGIAVGDSRPPGIDDEELAAHRALAALAERLTSLEAWLPESAWLDDGWQSFRPDALRLLVRDADDEGPDPGGLETEEFPWPGSGDPATFGDPWSVDGVSRCGVVAGAGADAWWAALGEATQLTRWTADGHRYAVTVRPLLPDEAAECPAGEEI